MISGILSFDTTRRAFSSEAEDGCRRRRWIFFFSPLEMPFVAFSLLTNPIRVTSSIVLSRLFFACSSSEFNFSQTMIRDHFLLRCGREKKYFDWYCNQISCMGKQLQGIIVLFDVNSHSKDFSYQKMFRVLLLILHNRPHVNSGAKKHIHLFSQQNLCESLFSFSSFF